MQLAIHDRVVDVIEARLDNTESLFFPCNELRTGSQGISYGHTHHCSYSSRLLSAKAKL